MFAHITQKHMLILAAVLMLSIVVAAVALFLTFGGTSQAKTEHWPPLTMTYEIDGSVHNGTTLREIHRLEYNSKSDWTDTVIASDSIETKAFGAINAVGSYTRRNGEQFETYDSINDDSSVDRITDSIVIPNQFLGPLHIFVDADLDSDPPRTRLGKALSAAATTTKVCYQSECEDNATGLAFDRGFGGQWIVLNDYRWAIPLRVGDDAFIVRELTLHVPKK